MNKIIAQYFNNPYVKRAVGQELAAVGGVEKFIIRLRDEFKSRKNADDVVQHFFDLHTKDREKWKEKVKEQLSRWAAEELEAKRKAAEAEAQKVAEEAKKAAEEAKKAAEDKYKMFNIRHRAGIFLRNEIDLKKDIIDKYPELESLSINDLVENLDLSLELYGTTEEEFRSALKEAKFLSPEDDAEAEAEAKAQAEAEAAAKEEEDIQETTDKIIVDWYDNVPFLGDYRKTVESGVRSAFARLKKERGYTLDDVYQAFTDPAIKDEITVSGDDDEARAAAGRELRALAKGDYHGKKPRSLIKDELRAIADAMLDSVGAH